MFGMLMAACTSGKLGAPTTMITGHIVTAANLATKAALSGEGLTRGERHKAAMSATVLVCTFLGASTGAVVCSMSSERAEGLLLPVPPLLAILLWFSLLGKRGGGCEVGRRGCLAEALAPIWAPRDRSCRRSLALAWRRLVCVWCVCVTCRCM